MRRRTTALLAAAITTALSAHARAQLVSFPGAQGFGADATGGRGGSIYVVSNYNSSGAGSFEDAVSGSNRIIVFAVGGYVNMSAAYSCGSNLTILGQTAPGQGIALMGHELSFTDSTNCIVQYIRAREGSTDTSAKASINLGDSVNMMLDHVDAEFSQYDNIDAVGANSATDKLTLQNSLIADPIKAQQFNMHTEGNSTTYLNNIFANGEGRSVLSKASAQFVNNAIYNYGYAYCTGDSAGVYSYDIINNDFVPGQNTNDKADAFYQLDNNQSAYSAGNLVAGTLTPATSGDQDTMNTLASEWSPATKYLPTQSTSAAWAFDAAHSGALYSNGNGTFSRDQVDSLIISQMESNGSSGSVYNEQDDDGLSNNGFGTIPNSNVSSSTLDTVPFTWLQSHGLSTTSAAQLTMPNALGYDMIEEYAQQVGDQYASQTATSGEWGTTTWSAATPGLYDHALIRGTGIVNGLVTISGTDAATAFTVSIGGNGPAAGETLNITGGSLVVQDTIYVGDQNNGTLNITGGTVRANNIQLGNTVWNANGSASTNYNGLLALSGGVLTTGQIVLGGGVPGSWTTGGSINWSGGTLQSIGTGPVAPAGSVALYVNVPINLIGTGGTLDTNSSSATIAGVTSGTGSLKIIGGGTLSLTGINTYTGVTTISNATLAISSLVNAGVPSELGASSNAAGNLILDGGTLAGTGGTDRLFTLTANGGTLDQSGGVSFSNTSAIALPLADVTLTLTGSNTGHESFSPALTDPGNGFITSVLKTGVGKWTFNATGDKTYSGATNVSAGTLESLATNAFSANSTVTIAAGAYIEMHGYSDTINGLQGAGTVEDDYDHGGDSFTIGANNGGGTFTGNLGNGSLPNVIKVGTGTEILAGTDGYTAATTINGGVLQFNTAASIGGTGASVAIAAGAADAAGYAMDQPFLARITTASTGTAALAVNDSNNLDFSSATGANLPNVSLGAVGSVTYSGTITPYGTTYRLGGGGGILVLPNVQLTGADNVLVTGPGTVVAGGANTYTGITTITAGGVFFVDVANGFTASGMGQSSNASSNLILDGGTLQGEGTTDRSFTLTSNGGSLDNSYGFSLDGTAAVALPNTNVTLTLTGSSTAHNLFNLPLTDPGNGFVTSVTKTGTGKWTFSANNVKTYSGPTSILSGQLEALNSDSFSHNSELVIDSPGSLEMHDYNVTINGLDGNGEIYDSFISGTRTLTIGANNGGGTWAGNINSAATLNVVKTGTGTQSFTGANTYVGSTTVAGGTLTLSAGSSLITTGLYTNAGTTLNLIGSVPGTAPLGDSGVTNIGPNPGTGFFNVSLGGVTIASTGQVNLLYSGSRTNRTLLITTGLTFAGGSGAWQGTLDLAGNDLIVNSGNLANLTSQIAQGYNAGHWNGGGGILSTTAAASTTHLTAIGILQNINNGILLYGSGTTLGLFDGYSPATSDVLVKYTFYGDANLDGKVDGSDYSRIDAGFIGHLTGWYNGDFNYDGVVDGSDYALIDNSFNTQGVSLAEQIATPTTQTAGAVPVPEPAIGVVGVVILGLLGRRKK